MFILDDWSYNTLFGSEMCKAHMLLKLFNCPLQRFRIRVINVLLLKFSCCIRWILWENNTLFPLLYMQFSWDIWVLSQQMNITFILSVASLHKTHSNTKSTNHSLVVTSYKTVYFLIWQWGAMISTNSNCCCSLLYLADWTALCTNVLKYMNSWISSSKLLVLV